MDSVTREAISRSVGLIRFSRALVLTAGAGMGVDSGLPDFRGPEGFWKAYPPIKRLGLSFPEGFFGHRYNLYKSAEPHEGFQILLNLANAKPEGYFVLTSNVDGHFQKAGFPETCIYEIHGSTQYWQCCGRCKVIWEANQEVVVDNETFKPQSPLPLCPTCNQLARPNVLMFGDWHFNLTRSNRQERRFHQFVEKTIQKETPLAIIEIGCGLAVPTVRLHGEQILSLCSNAHLIRINPRDCTESDRLNDKIVCLSLNALTALHALSEEIKVPGENH